MTPTIVVFATLFLGQNSDEPLKNRQGENPLYHAILKNGFEVDGTRVTLPAPRYQESMSADAERAALREIAGSDRAVADLTRDSVVAPFLLKIRDEPVGNRGVIRTGDLWFVVRAAINDIDPDQVAGASKKPQTVEAANMRFTVRPIDQDKAPGTYVHVSGRMLDKIQFEATNQIEAIRSEDRWLIASQTDQAFNNDPKDGNRWSSVTGKTEGEPYPGGASVLTINQLKTVPGALLVESHFAYFEPKAWFDGAPILRSKIGVVAQDRIRALRRELAKSQKKDGSRSSSGPKGG